MEEISIFYHAFRVGMYICTIPTFFLATRQLIRDEDRFTVFVSHGVTHVVFRKFAWLISFLELIVNIDYFGVFGIFPPELRVFFKWAVLSCLSAPILTYLFFAAKSSFPFVFANASSNVTKRMRNFVFFVHIFGNFCYAINAGVSNRAVLLISNVSFVLIAVSVMLASYALFLKLRSVVKTTGTSETETERRTRLLKHLKRWRNFTCFLSISLGIVVVKSMQELVMVIRGSGAVLLPLDEKLLVDPTGVSSFAIFEASLRVGSLVCAWLYLYHGWLTIEDMAKDATTSSEKAVKTTKHSQSNTLTNSIEDGVGSNHSHRPVIPAAKHSFAPARVRSMRSAETISRASFHNSGFSYPAAALAAQSCPTSNAPSPLRSVATETERMKLPPFELARAKSALTGGSGGADADAEADKQQHLSRPPSARHRRCLETMTLPDDADVGLVYTPSTSDGGSSSNLSKVGARVEEV